MARSDFYEVLQAEVARIDAAHTDKRHERVIQGFTDTQPPQALINGQPYHVFNSNDYLGLRHHPVLKQAEHAASQKFGTGPGAVRFISGSLAIHLELETALAKFHGREAAMVVSSAFATNVGVLFSLIKGQSKDSKLQDSVLVVSDELNHRSIIDGVRLANLSSDQKVIFKHMDGSDLDRVLAENVGKFDRVVVITDGVFSMLGEYQDLAKVRQVVDSFDNKYAHGVLLVVDDCHGVAAFGDTGRGTEEVAGAQADVLIGTLGKGFGTDGGYVVADQVVVEYLRESVATYIYSNSISPATAGAALAAVKLVDSSDGHQLIATLQQHIADFKQLASELEIPLAADSVHPIQPVLIGDSEKSKAVTRQLFEAGYMVTSINYPVVPPGKDEIRVQLSAAMTSDLVREFAQTLSKLLKEKK